MASTDTLEKFNAQGLIDLAKTAVFNVAKGFGPMWDESNSLVTHHTSMDNKCDYDNASTEETDEFFSQRYGHKEGSYSLGREAAFNYSNRWQNIVRSHDEFTFQTLRTSPLNELLFIALMVDTLSAPHIELGSVSKILIVADSEKYSYFLRDVMYQLTVRSKWFGKTLFVRVFFCLMNVRGFTCKDGVCVSYTSI